MSGEWGQGKQKKEQEGTGLFLSSVKDVEQRTKTDSRTESDGAVDISFPHRKRATERERQDQKTAGAHTDLVSGF